jgi:hypothetical protein
MPRAQAVFVVALLLTFPVRADQESRSEECHRKMNELSARDRAPLLRTCLSENPLDAANLSPQERMKKCASQAEGKTGEDRKLFMMSCLKR